MIILTLIVFVLFSPAVIVGQTSDEFFNAQAFHEVRLYIHSGDLDQLRERYLEDIYYPADFEWRGVRMRNVGVRVRGLATRSATKPGLRIDFNRYVEEQTFLGMRSLVLDNALKDPSLVRERASMAFIRRMGQPASRESLGRVYINGAYQGVYALVETVDTVFLARAFGEGLGYLFEHKFANGFYAEFLGEDYAPYKLRFDAQTHRLESDYTLYSPIRELFREANQEVDAVWRERVGWFVDLNQLVTHVAIETFLGEFDGFLGGSGMANFYLYRPVAGNLHRMIAWDRDTTFQQVDAPIFARVEENALFRRVLVFPDLRALFLDVLEQCARAAAEDRWLETEILQAHYLIRDAVREDNRKPYSNEAHDSAIVDLLAFARQRPAFVIGEVSKAR
jgi:spore coat protein CotH